MHHYNLLESGNPGSRRQARASTSRKPKLVQDAGAQLDRWRDTPASAQLIVDYLIRQDHTKLQIKAELDEGKTLEETRAGSVIKEDITALAKKHKVDMQDLQKEIEEATKTKQAELLAELTEECLKTEQQMLKILTN
jgi:hypothetical protein